MPPSEDFWKLLLGDDVVSELFVEKSAAAATGREPAHNAEGKGRRSSQEAGPPGSAESALRADDKNVRRAAELGIDCFLRMAGEELCKQPALLHVQAEEIVNAQDELAVQNCSLFLASSKALNSLRCSVKSLSSTLVEMDRWIQPLHNGLKQFKADSDVATSQEASLHILLSMQRLVSELLELPALVLNCSNGGLYDEAVDVLIFADEQIALLRANGCRSLGLLDSLELQLKEARSVCVKMMMRRLGQQTHLSASLKLVGPLRRLSCSERLLKTHFLQRRDGDIARQRHNAEATCKTDLAQGLCAAAELLRVDALQTAVHYRAIFGSTDGPLSAWLADQVHWFVRLVQQELTQGISSSVPFKAIDGGDCRLEPAELKSVTGQTVQAHESKFRVSLLDLATVFRHSYSAAYALRRLHCYFFPAVALAFDRYILAMHRDILEATAVAFAQSLDGYDYQPSTVYFKLLEDSPWFQSCLSANAGSLFLLRHAPLSNLYNSIAEVLNSFQECSISTAVPGLVNLIRGLMVFCIHKVSSVKLGKRSDCQNEIDMTEQQLLQKTADWGSPVSTQAEFFVFSDIFAWVLVPTVCRHLSAIFTTDTSAFCKELCLLMEEVGLVDSASQFASACSVANGAAACEAAVRSTPVAEAP